MERIMHVVLFCLTLIIERMVEEFAVPIMQGLLQIPSTLNEIYITKGERD